MMRRILICIQYDGTEYVGWQRQINGVSVQEKLEEALEICEKRRTGIVGASRTDSGVHARNQYAHFDTCSNIPVEKYPFVFNALLPRDISVSKAYLVPNDFSARFNARGKEYMYRILNSRHNDALKQRFYAHVPLHLDDKIMDKAAKTLIGRHDFSAFEAAGAQSKTTVRQIEEIEVVRQDDDVILRVRGNAFLYNMVRIIAGSLIQIGLGRLDEGAFKRALETKNRLELGPTAEAKGLCLNKIYYELGGQNE